ncbi:MAG: class I SAM-dependent methyltransferase [Actinobacteria bacterium]|nr:class I SAM-dependent methyltransferase [Actinomycetota bacterium]
MSAKENEPLLNSSESNTSKEVKEQMDKIYSGLLLPLDDIPWNQPEPPAVLVELIESGKVSPCKAIDLGCGTGNYAIYLASQGFDVTGVDISPKAIEIAKENARKKGVRCNFIVADVLKDFGVIEETFDFAYDWEFMHHIFPRQRKRYVENVNRLLNPKAKYLSVCFSEKDRQFGGKGKYRKTRLGTCLYFSSEDEIRKLFRLYFNIFELKTIEISGKPSTHFVVHAFMEKKSVF